VTGRFTPVTVLVDPVNTFTEISKDNNKAYTYLIVNGSTLPNLTTSYKDIVITPSPANQGGNANISALIKNEGFPAVQNVKVNFYKGTPGVDGVLIGSQTVPSLNSGDSSSVSIDWTNIPESGERIIYIKVDPDNQITEISKDDNAAFTTLKILSLPDLAISSNSISFSPSAPKDGDTVSINVMVQNKGEQGASNVTVRANEGSTVIGIQTIPSISSNSQASTTFTYDTTGKSGAHQITVVVDPENTITEQSKDNNSAFRTFGVQDANLWLTEQYISPNGDGVKDSTQFFFRLSSSQTVKIAVVNNKGQTVRTFSGSEFNNTTSGNITWDGLDDNGMVVDDGQYQIKIVDVNNNVLGSLLVVVDNNRSPLTDAIGTKYLMNNNLTCMLPDISENYWQWFPDESSIVFSIEYSDSDAPEYPAGVYTVAPDGEDILRLIPRDWTEDNPDYIYYYFHHFLSPDGEKVAFTFWKYDTKNRTSWTELWIVDSDGKNLRLLDKSDNSYYLEEMKWSPDKKYIAYINWRYNSYNNEREIWIINIDTLEKIKIDSSYPYHNPLNYEWSPDSAYVAYVKTTNPSQWVLADELVKSDIQGNKTGIIQFDYPLHRELYWIGNQRIVSEDQYSQLWFFDTSGAGNHIELSDNSHDFILSPDKKNIAFTEYDDKASVKISDDMGNVSIVYESSYIPLLGGEISGVNLSNLVWSYDGKKLAFVDITYKVIEKVKGCPPLYEPHLIVIDISTKGKKAFKVDEARCDYTYECAYSGNPACYIDEGERFESVVSFFQDNIYLLLKDSKGYFLIDSETGERKSYLPIGRWWGLSANLSPLGRYITYYQYVDPSSVCYGRGYQDLWALSSLLNLTADLRVTKEKSAIILKGSAADLNFEGYKLEYADTNNSNVWNQITPPSDTMVLNDVFTTWVPPYEGIFYVRLTVRDKAGNAAVSRKRISWGLSSSITNIYKSHEIFSPNGDGVKDTVALNYTVLEPVHLEFNIYDENNSLIRTFLKEYTTYAVDYITWDGRDENGRIVPDGKYKIKVFDYEFFVEVDSTPPDVGISLKGLRQDFDILTLTGTLEIYTELEGHVVDKNLKNWIVEYGEGDNPQEWYEYISGEDQLVGRDEDGNPVLEPIKDDAIETYFEDDIEWLVGKKLKITSEDFAGNRSTAITDFLEERMALYTWDKNRILLGKDQEGNFVSNSVIYADLAKPGLHILELLETIRLSIVSMNVQYHSNGQWLDSIPVMNPTSGIINLEWDNSSALQEINAVRINAVDILGHEHYSNELFTKKSFEINLCNFTATNSLFEDLELLKIQILSSQDIRYSQWTDYRVFDSKKGDLIPIGTFDITPNPEEIKEGMTYRFKMIGIGISGKEYIGESKPEVYPPEPGECKEFIKLKFSLSVNYKEADCGLISDGKALLSAKIEGFGDVSLRTLSYYIQKPEGLQLLRQFDIAGEGLGSVTIDTLNMPEGSYPVKAVLSYLDLNDNRIKELTATNTLIVDRVLPSPQITYPGKSLVICPVKVSDIKGDWYGISIEGIAIDNTNVKRYELYYGIGENPKQWMPAMTRKYDYIKKAVVDEQIIGYGSKQGKLGVWNLTDIKGTTFSLKLKAIDTVGNVSCYTTNFSVDDLMEISDISTDKSLFSPNGDGVLDDITINYKIDEYATVDVKVFKLLQKDDGSYVLDSTPVRTIVSGLQHLGGTENTTWDGKDDSNNIVSDGYHGIAVYATDSC
ncbi:MAG: hypothetical protein EPN88_08025, partial [Bacteroidetes bacterium]